MLEIGAEAAGTGNLASPAAPSGSFYWYQTSSGAMRMVMLTNGNVGFGTVSPQSLFDCRGTARIGDGTNYASFAADGTLSLVGTATVWDDLRFPAQAINPAGSPAAPAVSQTTGMLEFSDSVDNVIAGQAQMPHSWKYGSAIHPHLHLLFPTANNLNSRWKFEYTIVALNGASSNLYGIYTNGGVIDAANPNSASGGRLFEWPSIDMTGQIGSCTLLWKISRLAASDAADTDPSVVVLTEFDIHYEMDKLGSSDEIPV